MGGTMYAVSRAGRARPERLADATAFVIDTGEFIRSTFGMEVRTSTQELGEMGVFAFTSRWASLAELDQTRQRLMQDARYLERLAEGGSLFLPGVRDHVFMTLDGSAFPEPSPVTWARFAVARNGRWREASEFAAHIGADVGSRLDVDITSVTAVNGVPGTFAWLTGYDSVGGWEDLTLRFMADETSGKAVDDSSELWIEGSARDQLWRALD